MVTIKRPGATTRALILAMAMASILPATAESSPVASSGSDSSPVESTPGHAIPPFRFPIAIPVTDPGSGLSGYPTPPGAFGGKTLPYGADYGPLRAPLGFYALPTPTPAPEPSTVVSALALMTLALAARRLRARSA